jgi:hypothetical protein
MKIIWVGIEWQNGKVHTGTYHHQFKGRQGGNETALSIHSSLLLGVLLEQKGETYHVIFDVGGLVGDDCQGPVETQLVIILDQKN